jgi:hypothetical protein
MKAGIVILNYNSAFDCIELIDKIYDFDNIQVIVLVDNASTDNSKQLLTEYSNNKEKIKLILSNKNGGYAKGNNIGLRYLYNNTDIEIAFVSNPDVLFDYSVIEQILECFENYSQYVMVTCKRVDKNGKCTIRQYWNLPTYRSEIASCFAILRRYKRKHQVYFLPESTNPIEVDVVPGAFWGIRIENLAQVGFLDENTFLFYEENCLAYKLLDKKKAIITNVYYITSCRGASTGKLKETLDGTKVTVESQRYFVKKYLNASQLKLMIFYFLSEFRICEKKIQILTKKILKL